MNKIWKPTEPNSDKLILIREDCIYKGNPSFEELNSINEESINVKEIKSLFSIPFSYIKKVENQKGKGFIHIYLGKETEEQLKITNENLKNEIFDFIKKELTNFNYTSKTPNIFSYAKTQIFGIIISTIIFIWAMYFDFQLSRGTEYVIHGSGVGLVGLVLLLARFGMAKLIIGYSLILGIGVFSFLKKIKSRSEIQVLKR